MRKMRAQWVVREDLAPDQELLDEQEAVMIRTGGSVELKAVRLTFFRDALEQASWRELNEPLGYVVLVGMKLPNSSRVCFILESVIRVPTIWMQESANGCRCEPVTNYYVHCCREFETVVGTAAEHRRFKVVGSFFCQQNDLTHVCAHAALRMGINSSPAHVGAKLTNRRINELLDIDHKAKHVGKYDAQPGKHGTQPQSKGLTTEQIVRVVREMGWEAQVAEFNSNPAIDYEDYIYPVMESGCPVILGIHGQSTAHVLAVLGHTLNSDRWSPEARHGYGAFPIAPYISTSAWADHFIVSDDNFGMYVTVPTESIRNILVPKFNPNLHASLAIGLVPKGVTTAGYAVEQSAASVATKLIELIDPTPANRWLKLLKEPEQKIVCRTLLVEKASYIKSMKEAEDEQKRRLTDAELSLLEGLVPERAWLTELSVPNLYTGNKRKLGDIVTIASAPEEQFLKGNNVRPLCWLPGFLLTTQPGSQVSQGWSLFGHVPLFRGACQAPRTLEW